MSIPDARRGTSNNSARGARTTSRTVQPEQDYGLRNRAASGAATQRNQQRQLSFLAGLQGGGAPTGPSGSRRGGSSGASAAARAEAQRQAQLAAQRQMVEDQYSHGVGRLDQGRADALGVLPGYRDEALGRLAQIYAQNQQQAGFYGGQINQRRDATMALLREALGGLNTDLAGQGVDAQALRGAGAAYQADATARGGAASNFNDRLSQVMATGYGDQQAATTSINQGAMSGLEISYQQALAELQAQRTAALMGLV